MKIGPHKLPGNQGVSRSPQDTQKSPGMETKEKAGEIKESSPAEEVDISEKSENIADIMSAVNQLPDIREKKIQAIKQSVEAGTYTIDPGKVAEKILKEL
jgi:negative regulator of flagellin synthesis FlgM